MTTKRARRRGSSTAAPSAGASTRGGSGAAPTCDAWGTLVEVAVGAGARRRSRPSERRTAADRRRRRRRGRRGAPTGHRRARPRARRRARARVGHAARRRARHGQEHAAAPGARPPRRRRHARACWSPPRSRRSRCAMRAERLGALAAGPARSSPRRRSRTCVAHVEAVRPDVLALDSIQTVARSRPPRRAGSVTQVRDCAYRLVQQAQGARRGHGPRRPRHQGRHARRAARARARRRHRALVRRRPRTTRCGSCTR